MLKDYTLTEDKKKIVNNDLTFVSTPQPSEYAFQYAELQLIEEHPVSQIEVLNTKKNGTSLWCEVNLPKESTNESWKKPAEAANYNNC